MTAAYNHDVTMLKIRDGETISGHELRKALQNSLNTALRSGNDDADDCTDDEFDSKNQPEVECYSIQLAGRHQPRGRHVNQTQTQGTGSTSNTWMATLLHSLHFRLIGHNDRPPTNSQRPPPQCLVYVLDSDLQPPSLTFASCFKPEAKIGRSASVVSQYQNAVESPTSRRLPDMTSSLSPSSCRIVATARPAIPPKPISLQSPPLAARYPLRRMITTAEMTMTSSAMTSSVSRGVDATVRPLVMAGPPPPPLPARRGKLPPTDRNRPHLDPTSFPLSEPAQPMTASADEQDGVSETARKEADDDDDELNYKVEECDVSMLDCVLQAAKSLSVSHNVTTDDDDDDALQQQLQLADNSHNLDDNELVTPRSAGRNLEGSDEVQHVSTEEVSQSSSSTPSPHISDNDLDLDDNEDESLSVEVPPPDYATYAFYRDTSTNVPADTAVNHVNRTASILAANFRQNSAVSLLPDQRGYEANEGIYESVDDSAYLYPSPTYWHELRGPQSGRRVTLPAYCRRQSCDVITRRTLPRHTLLLVDDDDDCHVTGCDVTRLVLALDRQGSAFYVPRSSLRPFGESSGQPWYFPISLSAHQATLFVAAQHQNGCFVLYKPTVEARSSGSRPEYVLSVGLSQGQVLHYNIVRESGGEVAVEGDTRSFLSLDELVEYFRCNRGLLATRLRRALSEAALPVTAITMRYNEMYEIDRADLSLSSETWSCSSGVGSCHRTYVGTYKHSTKVIIRVLPSHDGHRVTAKDEEDDFFNEVHILSRLDHVHIVPLIGCVASSRPFLIVTQLMTMGSLRDYLRHASEIASDGSAQSLLLQMCRQMSSAVAYLAARRFIVHRQLSADCFYVSGDLVVHLGDFKRARAVVDDEFIAERQERVWIKWAAPEILRRHRYTTKSDVWALAVVFWEIYSGGAMPFECLSAEQTAVYVNDGGRLDRPVNCPRSIYQLMCRCWSHCSTDRPSAQRLFNLLTNAAMEECDGTQKLVTSSSQQRVESLTRDSDVVQLPRQRRHSQSLIVLPRRRHGMGALTRAVTAKHKWRFSLIVRPPTPPAPSTAPALSHSPSFNLSPLRAGAAGKKWSRARLSTLSVPDGRRKTRGYDGVGQRSNASTQSSDNRSDVSRDGHLSSCNSINNDNEDESASQTSQTKNGRHGWRKFVDKMTSVTNNGGSSKTGTGDNKH